MSTIKENKLKTITTARHIIYELGEMKHGAEAPLPLAKIPLGGSDVAPESIKLSMLGEEIIPTIITHDGVPRFSEEASLILYCKDQLAKHGRLVGSTPHEITVDATYTETERASCDDEEINTLSGISQATQNLSDFHELCRKRSIYAKTSPKGLNTFVVFGRIMLDEHGCIRRIDRLKDHLNDILITPSQLPLCCTKAQFSEYVTTYESTTPFRLPTPGERCPVCGKLFTIEDLYEPLTLMGSGLQSEVVHDKCKHEFEYYLEIKTLLFDIIDKVYPNLCKFEILDNPNILDQSQIHLPWILVHAHSGDIKLGRKYDKITIEWQPNYKPFDISILNTMSHCVKWTSDRACFSQIEEGASSITGVRGIAVTSVSDAIKALKKVHNYVFFSR